MSFFFATICSSDFAATLSFYRKGMRHNIQFEWSTFCRFLCTISAFVLISLITHCGADSGLHCVLRPNTVRRRIHVCGAYRDQMGGSSYLGMLVHNSVITPPGALSTGCCWRFGRIGFHNFLHCYSFRSCVPSSFRNSGCS